MMTDPDNKNKEVVKEEVSDEDKFSAFFEKRAKRLSDINASDIEREVEGNDTLN
jgi:hypothetical protein